MNAGEAKAAEGHIHDFVFGHASTHPHRPALVDHDGRTVSYGGYREAIEEGADRLRAHGVAPGDRVLLVAENCLATAVLILACSRVGASAVPVNARLTAAEIARVTAHASPSLVVYTAHVSREALAHADEAEASSASTSVGELRIAPHEPDRTVAAETDVAVILYTTGTTGAPKGVMLTHGNLRFAARASGTLRGLVADDHLYGVLPLTHVFGLASVLMATAWAGACVRMETRFRPDRLFAALRAGVTVFPAVPQMHALLMEHVAAQGAERLGSDALRYVSSGAAPLDPVWKRKAEAFYGIALQNGYGMTESTAGVCGTRNPIGRPDVSVGPPLPGVELRIAPAPSNDGGRANGSGDGVGEILTRGPHVMRGYFRSPEETARTIDTDGFLHTGDLGRLDADGNLHVVGRSKELIIRGGFNVYPPEVESALNEHPRVVQCAVVGRTIDGGDEQVLAFVECTGTDEVTEATLSAFVAKRLVAYKRPSRILVVGQLPTASTGKILKSRLLDTFAEQLVRAPPA